jgi:GNAT superfamily N-acetyltransferase
MVRALPWRSTVTDPAAALSAIHRSNQLYYKQVSECATLSCGVAHYSLKYPEIGAANQLREMIIPPGGSVAAAFDEAERFYADKGLRCHRCVPAMGQPSEPIEAFLVSRGWQTVRKNVMVLVRQEEFPPRADVRILPARAMRKAYRQIILADPIHPDGQREMYADVAADQLDDPQYDMYVAMVDGRPAGHGALFQVGDIGRIDNVFVLEAFRGQGVGMALMAHLLALSRRLAMRITCLQVDEGNAAALALYAQFGFEPAGHYDEFHRTAREAASVAEPRP